ncbi:MAG TPA: helix-turn-helix transcriptional regulator [Conexibacter sp.]|jgi:transcriptional regulator with XRE-family HTH domain|nr:helix-turn-helix transcriptional regulator [Conexibacter sp.]
MGATIRALRGHAHLSQVAFGARMAMHHNYLGALERGGVPNPGLETVDRVARGLDVSIAVLADSYANPPTDGALRIDAGSGRSGRGIGAEEGAQVLGEAIRLVRRRRGLTQAQLADAAALHRSHLGSIEAGEKPNPGIGTIASIARGLGADGAEPSLLPLLAQTFAGELTVADLRAMLAVKPSGSSGARSVPYAGPGI